LEQEATWWEADKEEGFLSSFKSTQNVDHDTQVLPTLTGSTMFVLLVNALH
jgi:hypothetical protein